MNNKKLIILFILLIILSITGYVIKMWYNYNKMNHYINLMESYDWAKREEAAYMLRKYNKKDSIKALERALRDDDYMVQASAIGSIAYLNKHEYLGYIIDGTKKNKDEAVRQSAVRALGYIGGEEQLEILGTAMEDDDSRIRKEAIWAISRIGGKEAIRILKDSLESQEGIFEELIKIELFKLGEKRFIPYIICLMSDSNNRYERAKGKELLNQYIPENNCDGNFEEWLKWWSRNSVILCWDKEKNIYKLNMYQERKSQ